jgi:hypothetical protein
LPFTARGGHHVAVEAIVAYLEDDERTWRIILGLTAGLWVGLFVWVCTFLSTSSALFWALLGSLCIGPFVAVILCVIVYFTVVETISRAVKADRRLSRRLRLAAGVIAAAAAWAIIAVGGTVLAAIATAVLPAAFAASCGLCACLLVLPRVRTTAIPGLKYAPDAIGAATTAVVLLLLINHAMLTTEPAAGLLFPLAVWGSVRAWRVMNASERVAVKAGADITLSLLLGAGLVLFLVWLANLLDLPRRDMATLRAVLADAGSAADVPWWVWAGLYLLLAGVSLAFLLRQARLAKVMRWLRRLRVVPAADAARRMLTCLHIGLLVIVFAGLATPPALAVVFQRQVQAVYTVALQRQLQAEGRQAAYTMVSRQFRKPTRNNALSGMVAKISQVSAPPPFGPPVTGTETEIANHLGTTQAIALHLQKASLAQAEQQALRQAGISAPIPDEPDLSSRLDEVTAEQLRATEADEAADQAGELAAKAVASMISVPHISDNAVFQIIRDYLSGLVEESGVKDWFALRAEHLTSDSTPDAEKMIVPDPRQLEKAALTALSADLTGDGLPDPVTDPPAAYQTVTDPALLTALREDPLDAAVDLVRQALYLQQGTGSCAGCASRPGVDNNPGEDAPGDDGGDGGDSGDGGDGGDGGGGGE